MKTLKKPTLYALAYALFLMVFGTYVLLDTFVIPRVYAAETTDLDDSGVSTTELTQAEVQEGKTAITLTTLRIDDTTVYVADIQATSASSLMSAFAQGNYGKNVTASTSTTALEVDALLAINGDFYGARNSGYVIRNGVLYRDTVASSTQEDLVVWEDGSFEIIQEGKISAQTLLDQGAQQVWSFGPALIIDGQVSVDEGDEVGQAMASNPRTAIGILGPLHYVFVVSDGRTDASAGLTLAQLADLLKDLGASTAYNLDGGGSSTLVYNDTVINQPTTNGTTIRERKVSDIVYIGG